MTAQSPLTADRLAPPAADEVPAEYRNGPARRVVMLALMPPNPPCFEPDVWREYTADCAAQDRTNGPLTFHFGEPVFNRGFDFCRDCSVRHAVVMDRQGRCKPDNFRKPRSET